MVKTLADMTAVERAGCVGMWCDIEGVQLAVIAEAGDMDTCVVIYPDRDGTSAVHLNGMVTPHVNLPRCWTPDGKPVRMLTDSGQCEIGEKPDGSSVVIVNVEDGSTEYAPHDTPHGAVYRWVGVWEQEHE